LIVLPVARIVLHSDKEKALYKRYNRKQFCKPIV